MRMATLAFVLVLAGWAPAAPAGAQEDFELHFPQPHGATTFVDDFGYARRGHRHQGVDLMGQKMMPVVAVAGGVVTSKGFHHTAGYHLTVEHAGGWESRYVHLNNDTPGTDDGAGGEEHAFAPGIEEGARVEAGDLLGWVGDSGNAEWTQPHTHFELLRDGQVVNPYPYLVQAWDDLVLDLVTARTDGALR